MVIILTGPDTFRSHERLVQLRDAFKQKYDQAGLNTVLLEADAMTAPQLRDACQSGGLFASRRMVIINNYEKKKASVTPVMMTELLAPYQKSETPIVVIRELLTISTEYRRTPPVSALKIPSAKVELFPARTPRELEQWLIKTATQRHGSLSATAAQRLVATVGNDSWTLDRELEKILTHCAGRPVTNEDIAALTNQQITSDVFALADAFGQRRAADALHFLRRELAFGTHPLQLLAILRKHVENLIQVASLDQPTAAQVQAELGLHPFVAKKLIAQCAHTDRQTWVHIHDGLVAIDRDLKSTPLDLESLVTALIRPA